MDRCWWRSLGAVGRFGAPVAFGTWPYGAPELGDVDGDGTADLIGRDGAAVVAARATGTGFAAPVGLAQLPRNYSVLRSGTLDGSGHLGLVGLDPESGRLRILDAPGTEDADAFAAGRWAKGFSFVLADVDGDGRDDAVGVDRRGRVRVGINEDSAFVVQHVWRIPARAAVAVADVTGDGHADLVYRPAGSDDVYVRRTGPRATFHAARRWGRWDRRFALTTAYLQLNRAGLAARDPRTGRIFYARSR